MNLRRGRWAWFGILAILALPAMAAKAQSPASAPAPADRAITPVLRGKMLQLITKAGQDRDIPAPISSALGLTPAGTAWPDYQLAIRSNGETVHAIAFSRGTDKNVVLTVRGPAAITVFRARPDGTLGSAVNLFVKTNQTLPLPVGEAQAQFADELAFWAANIDTLLDQN